jgi:polyhydroxybutyrate depolymerase
MVAAISESHSVDPKRIYATGLSNGALFANRLGCEASDLVAAIAPIAGGVGVTCAPPRPVPHLAFWGTADPFVPKTTIDSEMDQWRNSNGCAAESHQTFATGDATCVSWSPCAEDADTVLCTLEGGGHTWPGSRIDVSFLGPTSKSIDASREMLAFFEKHPMP